MVRVVVVHQSRLEISLQNEVESLHEFEVICGKITVRV